MEDRLETMSSTLLAMKELLTRSGITPDIVTNGQGTGKHKNTEGIEPTLNSTSSTTIYKNALSKIDDDEVMVDPEVSFKRKTQVPVREGESSSSDERIDTRDKLMEIEEVEVVDELNRKFIAGCEAEASSGKRSFSQTPEDDQPRELNATETTDEMICQAEASKIRMLAKPGKITHFNLYENRFNGGTANQHSSIVDKNYVSISANVDVNLCDRIKRGDYVDFAKLLPRDKLACDESKLELAHRAGQTFFVPASRDSVNITNFHKWEQAFRTYSNIYLHEHPDRATELLQYNHVICTASASYIWDNVYHYAREFRTHLGMYPERSWPIILQQAWSMCLKDRLGNNSFGNGNGQRFGNGKKCEICQRFNKGLCVAGRNCKYKHKCLECGKFRHGEHICCKKKQHANGQPPQAAATICWQWEQISDFTRVTRQDDETHW